MEYALQPNQYSVGHSNPLSLHGTAGQLLTGFPPMTCSWYTGTPFAGQFP
jgi:hypothetical protein